MLRPTSIVIDGVFASTRESSKNSTRTQGAFDPRPSEHGCMDCKAEVVKAWAGRLTKCKIRLGGQDMNEDTKRQSVEATSF